MTGGSGSFLRAKEAAVGLPKVGGGDFKRGEMGHLGVSRDVSWVADDGDGAGDGNNNDDFCGTGARRTVSV